MVSSDNNNFISGVKLSSVVPGKVTGDGEIHELTNMDLVMKFHYIKAIYFFQKEAVQGVKLQNFKDPMFPWLSLHPQTSGRIRCSEKGRPFIKCNDAGVRVVEAQCSKTLEECLAMKDNSLHGCLAYDQVLGHDLGFSPLIFMQFTWFRCGGLAIGLSWTHVLGNAFSASDFINLWGRFMAGETPPAIHDLPEFDKPDVTPRLSEKPFSVKKIDVAVDNWVTDTNCQMETYSFHVSPNYLIKLRSNNGEKISSFEILSALIWKSLAKIRGGSEAIKTVTIIRKNSNRVENQMLKNDQIISSVKADDSVSNADLFDLAKLIVEKSVGENDVIKKAMDDEEGKADFIMYGSRLTFVNLGDMNIYEFELNKYKPVFVNYMIGGVGEEGAVLVLPRKSESGVVDRRTLNVTLPAKELVELRIELEREWGII